MNINSTSQASAVDCRLCLASIAGVYAPLLILLGAALVVL